MSAAISGEQVQRTLGAANELAKFHGEELAARPELESWRDRIVTLKHDSFPKTYLAVLAVVLTARSMYGPEELDVRDIKAGKSERGYSAPSVASRVAAFAKEQRIDLRATSTQPMNNQPFTFKDHITRDMAVQAKFDIQWHDFYNTVEAVNTTTPGVASEVLALLFHLCRKVDAPTIQVRVRDTGKDGLDRVSSAVADYVERVSDNGKVGQAFVAALFDLIYTPDLVVLGATQDPDVTTPGDVQVVDSEGSVWLWAEAKQKAIVTGDITGFLNKVHSAGGQRIAYFALVNHGYSGNIQPKTLAREATRLGIGVQLFDSPAAALESLLPFAQGDYATVSSRLLERLHSRLVQSDGSAPVLKELAELAERFADVR